MTAREEMRRWKERCQWITETVRKKDVSELLQSEREQRKTKNLDLLRLPIASFSPKSTSRYSTSFK